VRIKTSPAPTPLQRSTEAEGEQIRWPGLGLALHGTGEDSHSGGHRHRVREQAVDQCW
jgi:hypothetical protein